MVCATSSILRSSVPVPAVEIEGFSPKPVRTAFALFELLCAETVALPTTANPTASAEITQRVVMDASLLRWLPCGLSEPSAEATPKLCHTVECGDSFFDREQPSQSSSCGWPNIALAKKCVSTPANAKPTSSRAQRQRARDSRNPD